MLDENSELKDYIPWAIIGVLVVLGGFTVLFAGLPWAQKSDVERIDRQLTASTAILSDVSTKLAVLTTVVGQQAATQAQITQQLNAIAAHQNEQDLHVEGLEADQKAQDAERVLTRHHR